MKTTKLKYGNTNTFLINNLLFDTDMFGTLDSFFKCIKQNDVSMNEIKYVLCSHYHPDHMGLVSELMKMDVKLVLVQNQKNFVQFSDKIFEKQFGAKYVPVDENKGIVITADESRKFLEQIGIQGQIITTSSHSEDGIALILDDGNCFVGDLEPAQFVDGYENNLALKTDWENIMKCNPKTVYFGHANIIDLV